MSHSLTDGVHPLHVPELGSLVHHASHERLEPLESILWNRFGQNLRIKPDMDKVKFVFMTFYSKIRYCAYLLD
jgi:hypothetical protein